MKIAFHGAAKTVTGSKHLITLKTGNQYLLDCGMFQGLGQQTDELNRNWGFDPESVNFLILSHAHIDHSGLIPKLVKDGFKGTIYCTPPTFDLVQVLLEDSADIQHYESRIGHRNGTKAVSFPEPLYSHDDVQAAMLLFQKVDYDTWITLDDQVELMFTEAGHLIGSAAINLKIDEAGELTTVTFSGDVGKYRNHLLKTPKEFPQADYLIIESTYGDSLHELSTGTPDKLLHHITNTCIKKKGKLVIPAFSIGRTQELLFALNQLELEKRLPDLDYFVDSPLSIKATEIVKRHPGCFKESVQKIIETDADPFAFKGLRYIREVEESQMLVETEEPCVVIAASGMAEAGRIRHHLKSTLGSARNTVLMVGYCDPESLGGQLLAGNEVVYIMGDSFDVRADVAVIKSLSAHGDYNDLLQYLSCQDVEKIRKLFLVHGEYKVQEQFRQKLLLKGFADVVIPGQHAENVLEEGLEATDGRWQTAG